MRKVAFAVIVFFVSVTVFGQTLSGSFQYNAKSFTGISQADVSTYITKGNFENYRLRDHRTTLSFDNGFEIILFSANELKDKGMITDASRYQAEFIQHFAMPVFHMTPDGKVSAAYPVINSKYSSEKR